MLNFDFLHWIWIWIIIGIVTFFIALKFKAPYGRHTSSNWGPQIDNKWAWFFMEIPAFSIPFVFLLHNFKNLNTIHIVILGLFIIHYFNRVFIYPFRIKTTGKKMPLIIAVFAVLFNTINGFNIGFYFTQLSTLNPPWFYDIRFLIGISLFITGMLINHKSDHMLINLRRPGETSYKIPKGFLFEKISCPNHFGEIVEWVGFAILSWSLPAIAFAIWTMANLIPRSINHHDWYRETFKDYPKKRRAVIPYVV
jgi:hypothetical protein